MAAMIRVAGVRQGSCYFYGEGKPMKLSPLVMVLALPLLAGCADNQGLTSVKPPAAPAFDLAQNLPLVYDAENTAAGFAALVPSFDQSPSNLILPDPFRSFSGKVDLTFGGWERHRAEVLASIATYEIGPKPPASDLTETASYANDTLTVVVTRKSNGKSVTFKSPIFLPAGGTGKFPAMIAMTWCWPSAWDPFMGGPCKPNGFGSLPPDVFTSRNIAGIAYLHDQSTTYISFGGHTNDPFYQLYPEYTVGNGNAGQYAAWSWGVSRLIDGIQIAARDGTLPIDARHLGVTGCSYAGKMALFAGAMDERIALTIAQESGGGGMPAWRVSEAIGDVRSDIGVEHIDNTNYTWFANQMRQFSGANVYKLPHDHHQLMSLVAPRALLATNNDDQLWLSNPAAYVSAKATQETYTELGIPDRFGFIIDGTGTGSSHNHCAIPATQVPIISAFVDKFLLGKAANTTAAVVKAYPTQEFNGDYQGWMPWSLRRDISQLVAGGTINAGQGNALSAKLEAALTSIAHGDNVTAASQLNAFANQVNAFVNSRQLTSDQAAVLLGKINSTKTRIGA